TDAAGNVGACSNALSYTHDSIAPTVSLTATSPTSPSNASTTPSVIGTSSEAATVELFTNGTCAGAAAATGTSTALASPGIAVLAAADTPSTIPARGTDAAGNVGACSNALSYTHDSIAPSALLSATNPVSPSTSQTPLLIGSSDDPAATIATFANGTCAGAASTIGNTATLPTGTAVTLPANLPRSLAPPASQP